MLVDDETWAIRYLVVNTSNWWLGHKVLIAPQWIDSVRWLDATVSVDLTRQAVKDSPPYMRTAPLDRQQGRASMVTTAAAATGRTIWENAKTDISRI